MSTAREDRLAGRPRGRGHNLRGKPHYNCVTHGHASTHIYGGPRSPTYSTWMHMRERCNNKKAAGYEKYSLLGYDPAWDSFPKFLEDMGPRPPGTSLDRIDNSKGYFKENCRWADKLLQARNRTTCVLDFETATQAAVALLSGDLPSVVAERFGTSSSLMRGIRSGTRWADAVEMAKKIIADRIDAALATSPHRLAGRE